MIRSLLAWMVLLGLVWIAAGCASEDGTEATDVSHTGVLAVEDPWVRPGSEGGMSALYFRLANGTATEDTLESVRTDVADTVEIHESYEARDGTRGMRPVSPVPIAAGQQVAFAPGGRHVMLIQLYRELDVGDSLVVDLQFAQAGIRSANVPVRMEPPREGER